MSRSSLCRSGEATHRTDHGMVGCEHCAIVAFGRGIWQLPAITQVYCILASLKASLWKENPLSSNGRIGSQENALFSLQGQHSASAGGKDDRKHS